MTAVPDSSLMMLVVALVLGVVEGLTEFLPISSSGHLIVASELLGFEGKRKELFVIFIQLGAILSVVWEYRGRLTRVAVEFTRRGEARRFVWNLAIAFLPAAAVGLLFDDYITEHLFSTRTVAAALVVGALLILLVESLHLKVRTESVDEVSWTQALWVGVAQCLALWPGFSRSAATILGGLGVGMGRRTATEFSFFLAIPVMFAATLYSFVKKYEYLQPGDLGWLALSFLLSFLIAWLSVRWLLRYVSTHTFKAFAWYRLVVGVVILLLVK